METSIALMVNRYLRGEASMNGQITQSKNWLLMKARIKEQPFVSETAVIGSLIAKFRELWNSIATKWYIRPLLQQQNEFNQLIAHSVCEQGEWLIAQDREQVANNHNIAELTTQLIQTNRLLYSIDERLSRLESHQ